jgi:uncharacterized protein (TIGR00299 family) protein
MNASRIDLSPIGGVAGDMFAAALLDALPELSEQAKSDVTNLGVTGLSAQTEPITSATLAALRFVVQQPEDPKPPRTLSAVQAFLEKSELSENVSGIALGIYTLLAKAEAAVHGKTIQSIHFHEVSDWDSMVDIVTAASIIAQLPNVQWRIGPLPLGGGTVKTAHGDIPVPAPATVQLLQGFEWTDDGIAGERVTPTGAAILKYLAPQSSQAAASPANLLATGSGAGTRKLPGRANILRATVFESSLHATTDLIESLAFEVDDMTGEEIGVATDLLRELDGVLDVSLLAMQGKKGRPVSGFRILVRPQACEAAIEQCFAQTTTLGVRRHPVERRILSREEVQAGGISVKLAKRQDELSAKAASDELIQNTLMNRRQQAQSAERDAIEQNDSTHKHRPD